MCLRSCAHTVTHTTHTHICIHYISQKKIFFLLFSPSFPERRGMGKLFVFVYLHVKNIFSLSLPFWENASNVSEQDSHVIWHVLRRVIAKSLCSNSPWLQKTEIGPLRKRLWGLSRWSHIHSCCRSTLSLILSSVNWQVEGSTFMVPFLFLRSPEVGAGRFNWSWVGGPQVGGNFLASMLH